MPYIPKRAGMADSPRLELGQGDKPRHSFDTVFREVGISNVEVNQL